jgi:hypothetical protein
VGNALRFDALQDGYTLRLALHRGKGDSAVESSAIMSTGAESSANGQKYLKSGQSPVSSASP